MAHVVHKGPYETCEPTYLALFTWIEENGLTICGPIREMYRTIPGSPPGRYHHGYLRAGPVTLLVYEGRGENRPPIYPDI